MTPGKKNREPMVKEIPMGHSNTNLSEKPDIKNSTNATWQNSLISLINGDSVYHSMNTYDRNEEGEKSKNSLDAWKILMRPSTRTPAHAVENVTGS
ncbi:hypothetical protein SAMD00023353_3100430 [Rosellinia necatrix]|uniref:Uncharacterized protein n=1 Tax=Rosellinia necatrix TaxID=77044 RepID=A0A1S8A8S2_ROSNE|nr:hypothetical protein SAMD00023353_3100430 [Rosellinia necatrix]